MPVKAPPPAPPPVFSWTGFYVGINGGYSVGSDNFVQSVLGNVDDPFNLSSSSSLNSAIAPKGGFLGLQSGYNYQTGPIVWGVEGDWQWANQRATSCGMVCAFHQTPENLGIFLFGASSGLTHSVYQKVEWFATARGRIGWTPFDGTMLYATAGGAWMRIDETDGITFTVPPPGGNIFASTTASFSNTESGYAVGAGAEFRLWDNWTGKVEYLHIDVGGATNAAVHSNPPIGPLVLTTSPHRCRRHHKHRCSTRFPHSHHNYWPHQGRHLPRRAELSIPLTRFLRRRPFVMTSDLRKPRRMNAGVFICATN